MVFILLIANVLLGKIVDLLRIALTEAFKHIWRRNVFLLKNELHKVPLVITKTK